MRAPIAILAGAGAPPAVCGILYVLALGGGSPAWLVAATKAGAALSVPLGALGAVLGCLAAHRRVSETPALDAVRLASIIPAMLAFFASLGASHEHGVTAGLVTGALVLLPGPLSGGVAARLVLLGKDRSA